MAARLVFSPAQTPISMTVSLSKPLRGYALGLVCTAVGAWIGELTGSLLPLSLGGAVMVMATVPLVRAIRVRRTGRRDRR